MRAFLDTSSLFKKYVQEQGSTELDTLLQEISEIAVSPVTWLEINTVVARRMRDHTLTSQQATWLTSEVQKDFQSFYRVMWNEALEETARDLVYRHPLATLDAIQLASGMLAKADLFVTSDHDLFEQARRVVRKATYI
jgi:predicted nucleic acid-binding protein